MYLRRLFYLGLLSLLIGIACVGEEAAPTPSPPQETQATPTSTLIPIVPTPTHTPEPILAPPPTPTPTPAPTPPPTPSLPTPTPTISVQEGLILAVMRNIAFQPAQFTIKVGSIITFTNLDGFPHTFTADFGQDISFDSETLGIGESFSVAFDTPGTFTFFCRFHPTIMNNGVITVVE